MTANLYIDNDKIEEVNFSIIDESMGAIGGVLKANERIKNSKQLFNNILRVMAFQT